MHMLHSTIVLCARCFVFGFAERKCRWCAMQEQAAAKETNEPRRSLVAL